jgi:hypothetical protein
LADNENDRAGQRRFVEAFTETMHAGAAGRKKVYVMAAVAAVVVSAGAAVGVGVVSSHKSAASSSSARLSALAHTTSPSAGAGNARASSAASAAAKHPAAHTPSGDLAQGAGATPVVGPAPGGDTTTGGSSSAGGATVSPTQVSAPSKAAATAKATAAANPAATANPTAAPTTTSFKVTGQVSCESGNSVEGVWVQAGDGPGYASWKGLGNGSTSDWWFTLPKDEPYSLHVGCGGSTSSWAVATYSPTVTGAQNSFNCYDVSGEANYGTCVSR